MLDFLMDMFATGMLLFILFAVVEYANSKSKKIRIMLICLISVTFCTCNAWCIKINRNTIPVSAVAETWREYTLYCRKESISWNELTFPEWLSINSAK